MAILYSENCIILTSAVFDISTSVTDRQDRWTENSIWHANHIYCCVLKTAQVYRTQLTVNAAPKSKIKYDKNINE